MRLFSNPAKASPALYPQPTHSELPDVRGAEVTAAYYGQRMAGDFYDFIRVGRNRVVFALLDVAGRQEENRRVILSAQKAFRERARELFASEEVNESDAMTDLCHAINRTVLQAEGGVRACPAFAGCYQEELGTLCYFNAGHTPGLVRDGSGVAELAATGLPLGLFSHTTCDAVTVGLEPGSIFLLVSRGITEGKYKKEEFGLERVKRSLQETRSSTAREVCLNILTGVQQFMRTPPTHNDVTALALVRTGETRAAAGKSPEVRNGMQAQTVTSSA